MADFYFQTKDLSVGYDGKPLIRDISIGIEKGEIVTLIGPNGSGKSTILKSIARQLKTIAGTVLIEKNDLKSLSYRETAQKMAVVLTERIKAELMTCWDVAATGRYPYTGRLGILTREDKQGDCRPGSGTCLDLARRDLRSLRWAAAARFSGERSARAGHHRHGRTDIFSGHPTQVKLLSIHRSGKKPDYVIMSCMNRSSQRSPTRSCASRKTIGQYGTPEVFRETNIRSL